MADVLNTFVTLKVGLPGPVFKQAMTGKILLSEENRVFQSK